MEASYDKIHLFDAFGFRESRTVAPGVEPVTIDVDGVTVGLATCYDVRFPGLFQALADQGATVTLLPASWGAGPGKRAQWDLLTRARALDSTSFLLAAGAGAIRRRSGYRCAASAPTGIGGSVAVSPLGEVIAQLGEQARPAASSTWIRSRRPTPARRSRCWPTGRFLSRCRPRQFL